MLRTREKSADKRIQRKEGYLRPAISNGWMLFLWAAFIVLEIFFCIGCLVALFILWIRGWYQIYEWYLAGLRHHAILMNGEHQPQEFDWREAWVLARARNRARTFMVDRFLKVSTGSDLKAVSLSAKRKAAIASRAEVHDGETIEVSNSPDIIHRITIGSLLRRVIKVVLRSHVPYSHAFLEACGKQCH